MTLRASSGARRTLPDKIRRVIELVARGERSAPASRARRRARDDARRARVPAQARAWPVGLESAQAVRDAGAVPATVGVLDGAVRVGLSDSELERFTADARKVGPRDLAAARRPGRGRRDDRRRHARRLPRGRASASWAPAGSAASTAATDSTSRPTSASSRAPRRSSSRRASSRCSTCRRRWSCSRRSASRSLGYRTDELPLFYTAHGGPPVPARVESADEAAAVARTHWRLRRHSALLLAQPPPESLDDVEPLIEEALAAADEQGVTGPAVTPFVLAVPARAKRRPNAPRQPRARARERPARSRGRGRLRENRRVSPELVPRTEFDGPRSSSTFPACASAWPSTTTARLAARCSSFRPAERPARSTSAAARPERSEAPTSGRTRSASRAARSTVSRPPAASRPS